MSRRFRIPVAVLCIALAAGCVPPRIDSAAGATVWMDPTYGDGFFSLPWPNDLRHRADGTLDLTGFPGADQRIELLVVTNLAAAELTDFGTQTAVYLRMTGSIDPASLPTPQGSVDPSSSVQLIDLDHPGERVPVIVRVEPSDAYRPSNLLSLLPYPGHTMRPATRYAAVITTGLRSATGDPIAPAPLLTDLDESWWLGRARSEQEWTALRGQRDAARAALAAESAPGELAGFTVFRTLDSTSEMRAITATLDGLDIPAPRLDPGSCAPGNPTLTRMGWVDLPDFQNGVYPFTDSGGGLTIDGEGRAMVQGWRAYPIVLRAPCGETPAQGWPIETFIDGTGGGANLSSAIGFVDAALAASIPPLFGWGTGIADPSNEGNFYNSRNPKAARINPLQQAANHIALLKVLEQISLDGASYGSTAPVTSDPTHELISGQSQGAQTLPIVASMHPRVTTVIAGAGTAGFYNQIAYRRYGREQLGAYTGTASLDIRNPWAQLVATVEDLAEPANYPNDTDFLNFAGKIDGCVPLEASRHLDGAQRLAIVNPQWPSIFGAVGLDPPVLDAPVSGNVDGRTRVSLETPGGHGTAYDNQGLARDFTTSSFTGLAPTVPVGPYGTSPFACEPRWGEIGSGL